MKRAAVVRPEALAAWTALEEPERSALAAALQRIADAEGRSERWNGVEGLSAHPAVEVFETARAGADLVVKFRYSFSISRTAQAGSDWMEIHFHTGEATCRDGAVVSCSLEKREQSFPTPDPGS